MKKIKLFFAWLDMKIYGCWNACGKIKIEGDCTKDCVHLYWKLKRGVTNDNT